ncbi:MAG: response regulator [Verrucomicrobiales bacterium]
MTRSKMPSRRRRKSILVADDRAEIRGVMQHFLEDAGCVVESAPDGRRALRMAEAARQGGEPYDAMVLDLRMPHADGSEVARRLRDAGYEGAIVIMSAHAMKEIKTQCLGSGCDAFLAKPVAREDLLQTLAQALRKKRKARPGDVRVLVVDDSQDAAEALSLLLGIHGFSAETAHSGESALEVFADSAPQVAIIDIGLPDISGYEVAARIRSKTNHDPDAAPILIALSGRANAEAAPEAVEADFDYYLEKPASAESVAALIRGAIEESAKS